MNGAPKTPAQSIDYEAFLKEMKAVGRQRPSYLDEPGLVPQFTTEDVIVDATLGAAGYGVVKGVGHLARRAGIPQLIKAAKLSTVIDDAVKAGPKRSRLVEVLQEGESRLPAKVPAPGPSRRGRRLSGGATPLELGEAPVRVIELPDVLGRDHTGWSVEALKEKFPGLDFIHGLPSSAISSGVGHIGGIEDAFARAVGRHSDLSVSSVAPGVQMSPFHPVGFRLKSGHNVRSFAWDAYSEVDEHGRRVLGKAAESRNRTNLGIPKPRATMSDEELTILEERGILDKYMAEKSYDEIFVQDPEAASVWVDRNSLDYSSNPPDEIIEAWRLSRDTGLPLEELGVLGENSLTGRAFKPIPHDLTPARRVTFDLDAESWQPLLANSVGGFFSHTARPRLFTVSKRYSSKRMPIREGAVEYPAIVKVGDKWEETLLPGELTQTSRYGYDRSKIRQAIEELNKGRVPVKSVGKGRKPVQHLFTEYAASRESAHINRSMIDNKFLRSVDVAAQRLAKDMTGGRDQLYAGGSFGDWVFNDWLNKRVSADKNLSRLWERTPYGVDQVDDRGRIELQKILGRVIRTRAQSYFPEPQYYGTTERVKWVRP